MNYKHKWKNLSFIERVRARIEWRLRYENPEYVRISRIIREELGPSKKRAPSCEQAP